MDTQKRYNGWFFAKLAFLIFLIAGTTYVFIQQRDTPYQHNTGYIFGTTYNITYQCSEDLNEEILAELNKVDEALSTFKPQSIISKINRNEQVETNQLFDDVFILSKEISQDTEGAFDITVAPLVNTWGFGFKQGVAPNPHVIDSLRQIVGFHKVSLKDHKVKKTDPRVMIDCSAIAKGYATDRIASLLHHKGVENYMVEIGGEIVTRGISEKRLPWKIGVTKPTDDPENDNKELQTVLNVTDKAMATSGNYRKFYYKNGKKYAHTIDPRTGYPVQHNILSATVLANTCARADAYATAFMVLGLEGAQKILEKHPDLMAYLIYTNPQGKVGVWFSPSMKGKIVE